MKFIAQKSQIDQPLMYAAAVAERRNTIPILANLRLSAKEDKVEITATDLEIQIKTDSKITSVEENGEITVSARKLSELFKSLPEKEELKFNLIDGKLRVNSNNFQADFATLAASDFPEIEIQEELSIFNIQANRLKRLLTKTSFAMAAQDVRYYLNGLLLEVSNEEIKAIATDGHRLAFSSQGGAELKIKNHSSQILPRKAALELSKILTDSELEVEVAFGNSFFVAKTKGITFSSKLIDGKFPDYEKVFPTNDPDTMTISRELLQSALTRSSVLSNEKYKGVKFNLAGNILKLTANNPEQESAEEVLEVNYSGKDTEIGFNISYILEALTAIETKDVEMLFYGEESSCVIKEPKNNLDKYVIMPMRL